MIRRVSKEDLAAASKVARAFVLQNVTASHFEVVRRVALRDRAGSGRLNYRHTDTGSAKLSNDGETMSVSIEFRLLVTAKPDDSDPIVSIRIGLELEYRRSNKEAVLEDGDLATFARINGLYNAWPYLREMVANGIVRVGYPSLTLPSLVISPKGAGAGAGKSPAEKPPSGRKKSE